MGVRKWAIVLGGAAALVASMITPAAAAPGTVPNYDDTPALSTTAYDTVELYYTLFDRTLVQRRRVGAGGWGVSEGLGGDLITGPAAMTVGSEFAVTYVFAAGGDRAVWYRAYSDGAGFWGPWRSFGGRTTEAPAVSCSGDATAPPTVYVRGGDGALWRKVGASGAWTSLGGRLLTAPAAAPAVGGVCPAAQDVLSVGMNGVAYEHRAGAWTSLGGYTDFAPTVLRLPSGRTEAYLVGGNGALYGNSRASDTAAWAGWRKIGGGLTTAPAVQLRGTTRIVVALGQDEHYWQATSPVGSSTWTWTRVP